MTESFIKGFNMDNIEGYIDKNRRKNTFIYRLREALFIELKKMGLLEGNSKIRLKDKAINEKEGYFLVNMILINGNTMGISIYGYLEIQRRVGRPYAKVKYARAVVYPLKE